MSVIQRGGQALDVLSEKTLSRDQKAWERFPGEKKGRRPFFAVSTTQTYIKSFPARAVAFLAGDVSNPASHIFDRSSWHL